MMLYIYNNEQCVSHKCAYTYREKPQLYYRDYTSDSIKFLIDHKLVYRVWPERPETRQK